MSNNDLSSCLKNINVDSSIGESFTKALEKTFKTYQDEIDELKGKLKTQKIVHVYGVLVDEINKDNIEYIKKFRENNINEYTKDEHLVFGIEALNNVEYRCACCRCIYNCNLPRFYCECGKCGDCCNYDNCNNYHKYDNCNECREARRRKRTCNRHAIIYQSNKKIDSEILEKLEHSFTQVYYPPLPKYKNQDHECGIRTSLCEVCTKRSCKIQDHDCDVQVVSCKICDRRNYKDVLKELGIVYGTYLCVSHNG
jgi:hypothetical protein